MNISTEGDAGDVLMLACLLKHLPNGPHTLLFDVSSTGTKSTPEGLDSLVGDLVRAQDYILDARVKTPKDHVHWRSAEFRRLKHYTPGETLMQAHLNHYIYTTQKPVTIKGDTPWLKVKPSAVSKGRIVINRTGRYRNDCFPWAKVVDHYKHLPLFVGLEHEWREFCGHFGYVDYLPTQNLMQVAQLIAGSELFIGNQSCANAIAEGLKHPRIQETSLVFPDCVFPTAEGYPKGQYVATGEVLLPAVGSRPEIVVPSNEPKFKPLDISRVPPGMWQYPGETTAMHIQTIAREVSRHNGVSTEQAKLMVYEYQCARLPTFFASENGHLANFNEAMKKLG